MKNILTTLFLFLSVSAFAQDLFLYEFDKNLSLEIPDDAEEGEHLGQMFIRGHIDGNTLIVSKSDKGGAQMAASKNTDMARFYQGVKDGILRASKGKALKDEMIEIDGVEVLHFSYSMQIDDQPNIIDSYVFFRNKHTYTIQFVSPEAGAGEFKNMKSKILDSITII